MTSVACTTGFPDDERGRSTSLLALRVNFPRQARVYELDERWRLPTDAIASVLDIPTGRVLDDKAFSHAWIKANVVVFTGLSNETRDALEKAFHACRFGGPTVRQSTITTLRNVSTRAALILSDMLLVSVGRPWSLASLLTSFPPDPWTTAVDARKPTSAARGETRRIKKLRTLLDVDSPDCPSANTTTFELLKRIESEPLCPAMQRAMMEFAKHDPNAARRFDLWHRHGFSVHTAGLLTGVREDAVVRDLTLAASWLTITTRSPTRGCRGRLFVSSPDGTRAMIVEGGGPARIVEQPGGRSVATLKCDPPFFETAWFMNQGDRLLTISDDGAVRVWNARSGLQLVGPRATAPEVIRD